MASTSIAVGHPVTPNTVNDFRPSTTRLKKTPGQGVDPRVVYKTVDGGLTVPKGAGKLVILDMAIFIGLTGLGRIASHHVEPFDVEPRAGVVGADPKFLVTGVRCRAHLQLSAVVHAPVDPTVEQ